MQTQNKSRIRYNTKYCATGCLLLLAVITFSVSNETLYSGLAFFGNEVYQVVSGIFSMILGGISYVASLLFSTMIYIFSPIVYLFFILAAKTYGISNIVLCAGFYCAFRAYREQAKHREEAVKSTPYVKSLEKLGHKSERYFSELLEINIKTRLIISASFIIALCIVMASYFSLKGVDPSISYSTFNPSGASYNVFLMVSEMLNVKISIGEALAPRFFNGMVIFILCFILHSSLHAVFRKYDSSYIIQIEGKSESEISDQLKKYRKIQ